MKPLFSLFHMASPATLRRNGVLGMNRRNAHYVLPGNHRSLYPNVDNKLITKQICAEHEIPTPATFHIMERHGDLDWLTKIADLHQEFVLKPACGAGGRGVVVVESHEADCFQTAGRETMSLTDLQHHASTILSGLFSLGGQVDRAFVEQRIVRHAAFDPVAVCGTPDIRIVLYRCVPVMAMVRLPTNASRGRANLHQGAVGAGIDMRTGRTTGGVCRNRVVMRHPDTGSAIAGFSIPHWPALLGVSMELADVLELGYVGVDLVVDHAAGPVVLEANARPGLAIQLANHRGLLPRLEYVDNKGLGRMTVSQRWAALHSFAAL